MNEIKKESAWPKSYSDFVDDPSFHEDMAVINAQERICIAMQNKGINKAELARRLGKSKAFVTRLLSDGQNMTIKTMANVLFHLGEEIVFDAVPIADPVKQSIPFEVIRPISSLHYNSSDSPYIVAA